MLLDTRTESKRYVSIVSEGCCSQLCGATLRASTLPGLLMQTQPIFLWIVDSAIINWCVLWSHAQEKAGRKLKTSFRYRT